MKTDFSQDQFEFDFSSADFNRLRGIVTSHTGIELTESKKTLMYTRLVKRLRALNLENFSSYANHVEQQLQNGSEEEMMTMVNAMTTNVTSFFREIHHFKHLSENLEGLMQTFGKLRIWCCAASTGEEPWSLAMVVGKYLKHNPQADIKILATDIDKDVLKVAEKGIYQLKKTDVTNNGLMRHFLLQQTEEVQSFTPDEAKYQIIPELKKIVSFQHQNLLHPLNLPEKEYHVVFCRNVIIYFSKETQRDVFRRIAPFMPGESLLYIGHSESLLNVSNSFENEARTTYRKKAV